MVIFDFKEVPTALLDVWRSATTTCGAQCAMTSGAHLMPLWYADNLGIQQLVRFYAVSMATTCVYT